jgi:hypothetical protein
MAIGIIRSLLTNDFLVIFQITGNSLLAVVLLTYCGMAAERR